MNDIIPAEIEEYCIAHSQKLHPVLDELERHTYLKNIMPQMLSGPLQAAFLQMLIRLVAPKNVLEVGTFTGYSAITMALVLPQGATLHTIDNNDELETTVRTFCRKAQVEDKIILHWGDAKEVIPTLEDGFDFAFIDADKENYPLYFDLILPKMNRGGLILADNVLWSGKVLKTPKPSDEATAGIVAFNRKVAEDPRIENVIIPLRDGLNLIRVKG